MKSAFALLTLLAMFLSAGTVRAQAFGSDAPAAPQTVADTDTFGGQNPQLARLLQIQYQMQILKRLIEHERSVNNMVRAAIDIGLNDPALPAPDESLCRQVPANIPCAQSYAALYGDFMVATSAPPPMPALATDPAPVEAAPATAPTAAVADIAVPTENLFWTDITCLAKSCTAIVSPDVTNPKARYRIVAGDKLPDGAVIKAISAAGVTIERDKKAIALEPAPQA